MKRIDRAGIFKAVPTDWCVTKAKDSNSVAITVNYTIMAQFNGADWDDWTGYEEYTARGDHYVIKRDGGINTPTVEQLAMSLGWNGDLRSVAGNPPDVQVQITVKADEYNGQTRYKVEWVNPGDYTPQARGASESDVDQLQKQFGSQLRAAASSVKLAVTAENGQRQSAPAKAAAPAAPATEGPPDYGETPMPEERGGVHPDSTGGDEFPFSPSYI